MREIPKAKGKQTAKGFAKNPLGPKPLVDYGIDKNLAARARKVQAIAAGRRGNNADLPVDCAMHPALGDPAARFYPARVWAGELGANQTRHALFATSNQ